jgi:hypothetical protein
MRASLPSAHWRGRGLFFLSASETAFRNLIDLTEFPLRIVAVKTPLSHFIDLFEGIKTLADIKGFTNLDLLHDFVHLLVFIGPIIHVKILLYLFPGILPSFLVRRGIERAKLIFAPRQVWLSSLFNLFFELVKLPRERRFHISNLHIELALHCRVHDWLLLRQ